MLLADIRAAMPEQDCAVNSHYLCEALVGLEDRPWREWRGRRLSPHQLARMLAPFDIVPKAHRSSDGRVLRGYARNDFLDAWQRYLPAAAPSSG